MWKLSAWMAALWLAVTPAMADIVQQSGNVTPNHIPYWVTSGVIADGGTSADSPITSMGVTNEGGSALCVNSQRITAAGRQQLCLGAATNGPAFISLQNYGTATAQNLEFIINGTPVIIPTGGQAFALEIPPFVTGHASCFQSTTGILVDCGVSIGAGTQFGLPYYSTTSSLGSTGAGTNGQFLIGQTSSVPLWTTLSGDVGSVTAGGALTLSKVNGIPFASSYTAHGVLIGEGSGQFASLATSSVGQCLLSQGAGADPAYGSCASGSGSAGGSNTQVQFNNLTSLAGSPNMTWVSPALTLGVAGSVTGQLALASSTATGTVTLQAPGVSGTYNFNFPTGAGTTGQPMISGGGGSTPNTFGTLGVFGGGTNCSTASGTCLDNITGFSSTGFVFRSGAGTYTFANPVGVGNGGTGLANGTSGGILGFTGSSTIASSGALAQYGLVVGGGAGATPASIANGTAGQLLIAQTSANPAWTSLSGDATINNSGVITVANGAITVAKQANAAAYSLEGNFTGSSAAPQFSTIGSLTQKASPGASDLVLIQDQAAAGQLKYALVSSIASAGSVASIAGNTGAFTLNATTGLTNSTNDIQCEQTSSSQFGCAKVDNTSILALSGVIGTIPASKGTQQTGTNAAQTVTPLHQQDHDSAAKAWVSVASTCSSSPCTIAAGYNVTSVNRSSTGVYVANFTTAFASSAYSCHVQLFAGAFARTASKGTTSIEVDTFNTTFAAFDTGFDLACYGRQ